MATANLLARLPTRPPTPPKDHPSSDPVFPPKESLARHLGTTLLETPETPTGHLNDYFSGIYQVPGSTDSRGTKRKRVNFILTPTHVRHRDLEPPSSSPPSLPRLSPNLHKQRPPLRSRHSSAIPLLKPAKSILKVTRGGLSPDITLDSDDLFRFTITSPLTFRSDKIKMIEDICQQLATRDKSARLDAYRSLLGVFKVKGNNKDDRNNKNNSDIITSEEFKAQSSLLIDFILRDLNSAEDGDHRDGQITLEVLKVTNYLAFKNVFPESAQIIIVDWIISLLMQSTPSKGLVNNALLLTTLFKNDRIFLSSQNPGGPARAEVLFHALKNLHQRVSGKNILVLRLGLYRRLITIGHKSVFIGAHFWLRQMIEALMKDTKEFLEYGINLGREAAVRYGDRKEISKALISVLNEPPPASITSARPGSEQPYENESDNFRIVKPILHNFILGMLHLLDPGSNNAERAPQIWSIITLMMRHRSAHFRRWEGWGQWLTLLQKCFNSNNVQVKVLANDAWRDLIWASQDHILKDSKVLASLFRPILGQLERKESDKSKSAAESTFCTFLYYALQPPAEDNLVTSVWEDYIVRALNVHNTGKRADPEFSARVLLSLLGDEEQKLWNKDRSLHSEKLGPETLIRLDPRWVRANVDLVLALLDGHFRLLTSNNGLSSTDDPELPGDVGGARNICLDLWSRLVASIAEAGRREVKAPITSIKAVGSLANFALGLVGGSGNPDILYSLAVQLVDVLLGYTDSLPLGRKSFSREGAIISLRSNLDAPLRSALDYIIEFLTPECTSNQARAISADQFSKVVEIRLQSFNSRRAILAELRHLSSRCVCNHATREGWKEDNDIHACRRGYLWSEVADRFLKVLTQTHSSSSDLQDLPRRDLEDGAALLINGLGHSVTSLDDWGALLDALSAAAISTSGHCGLVLSIISPIASALIQIKQGEAPSNSAYMTRLPSDYTLNLLAVCPSPPQDASEFEEAHRSLWGASMTNFSAEIHPFTSVFNLLTLCLSSDNDIFRLAAIKTWKSWQSTTDEISVSKDLLKALQKTSELADMQLGKVLVSSKSPGDHPQNSSRMPEMPADTKSENVVSEESPLREFFSLDEPQRQDDSPTPAVRRLSRSQSEALHSSLPETPTPSSRTLSVRRSGFHSEPVKSLARDRKAPIPTPESPTEDATARALAAQLTTSFQQPPKPLKREFTEEPPHPSKKPKLIESSERSRTPLLESQNAFNSPVAGLSDAARGILARLRNLLGDVQSAVLGRTEAREIHRTLNQLNAATIDAEERGD